MSDSEHKISHQLNYRAKQCLEPSYKMAKLTPREGSGSVSITTSGGQQSHFDIPAQAYNLAKSVLSFTLTPPAAQNYKFVPMDCLSMIQQIQFYNRGGVKLCDIDNVGNYTKMLWKPETDLKTFLSLENHDAGTGAGALLQKCNASNVFNLDDTKREAALETNPTGAAGVGDTSAASEAANIHTAIDTVVQAYQDTLQAWLGQPSANARRHDDALIAAETGDASFVNVPYQEAKYLSVGATGTATPVLQVKLPLGMIYQTIFERDATLLFDEIMSMRITWAPSTRIYFDSADPLSPAGNTPAAATGAVAISNLQLFLAAEQRQEVINSLRKKVQSGMKFLVPYPFVYKNTTTGTPTSQNVILRFDRGHGRKLRKIYHSLFHITESSYTMYDNDNRSDAKCAEFYTQLDHKRLQDFNINTSAYEDYMLMKPKLEGSAILNSNVYQYNWVWCDDFTGDQPLHKKDPNVSCGVSLDQEKRWEFIGVTTAAANRNHYSVAILERELTISPSGLEIS